MRRILEYKYHSSVENSCLKGWGIQMSLKFSKALISGVVHLECVFRFGPTTLMVKA